MKHAIIAIAVVVVLSILVIIGIIFVMKTRHSDEEKDMCKNSVFCINPPTPLKSSFIESVCISQHLNLEEKTPFSFGPPAGFTVTTSPMGKNWPSINKDLYYAARWVEKSGRYSKLSAWSKVPADTSKTMPVLKWDAQDSTRQANVYRSLSPDGSHPTLLGNTYYAANKSVFFDLSNSY